MFRIPTAAEPLAESLRDVFTRPTFDRFLLLVCGVIVTMGRRTVSRALRVIEPHLDGHWCNYHRVYSQARFSMWKLAAAVVRQVVAMLPEGEPIVLIVDDTVQRKWGKRVWAKGAHRDAKRSSRSRLSTTFGHKWLVLCVLVKLPAISRPWALPVLCGLCRPKKTARKTSQRPKSASQISRQLLIRLMRWFPGRRFILLGDARAVSHEVAHFIQQHRDRITLVSRLRSDANLYDPPRRRRGARKGRKKPSPRNQVKALTHSTDTVAWYGSGERKIRYASDTGLWYSTCDLRVVPIRWVCVRGNPKLRSEDAYFYSTDQAMPARRIIELYALRWNIEVTFEESRALLGLETTRHWCRQSVLRVTPILFGLFTSIALVWSEMSPAQRAQAKRQRLSQTPCYQKREPTFSDALYLVRQQLWETSLLQGRVSGRVNGSWLQELPQPIRSQIIWHLSAAA